MNLEVDQFSLSLVRGMVAAVNPCGFVLLPTYLLYFLGIEASGGRTTQRATLRRALLVGCAVTAGFVTVFVLVGLAAMPLHRFIVDSSRWLTVAIGVGFVVLGTAILAGYRPKFATPQAIADRGARRALRSTGVLAMVGYGVAYAIASLGCTMPLFLTTLVTSRNVSAAAGVANVTMYGVGMGLVVIALTVSLASANQVLLRWLRWLMQYVDLLAAAFMLIAGLYLVWYGLFALRGDDFARRVDRWQARAEQQLLGHWQPLAGVFALVIVAAALIVWWRRPSRSTSSMSSVSSSPELPRR